MPEFFLTEPEIYEGTLSDAFPQLASLWAAFVGGAFAVYLYCKLVNPLRVTISSYPRPTESTDLPKPSTT